LRPATQHRPHHPGTRGMDRPERTAAGREPGDSAARRREAAMAPAGGPSVSEDNFDDELDGSLPSGPRHPMAARFRGYLPVVVDVETGGFNAATDALLEIAATTV